MQAANERGGKPHFFTVNFMSRGRDIQFRKLEPGDLEPWDGEFETLPEYAEITVPCAVCGEPIQCSTWYRAVTCSTRCAATLRKRRQRKRERNG